MKLLHCTACGDVVRLYRERRSCQCRRSEGHYTTDTHVLLEGPSRAIGIDTGAMIRGHKLGDWHESERVVRKEGGGASDPQADRRHGSMTTIEIHHDSHTDHLRGEQLHWLCNLSDVAREHTSGLLVTTVEMPERLGRLACGLYGPAMGDEPICDEETFNLMRPGRDHLSRCVARDLREVRTITVVAGPHDGHDLVLYTAYPGPAAPREVAEAEVPDEESRSFWAVHALAVSPRWGFT